MTTLNNTKVKSWRRFAKVVRVNGCQLLRCMDQFPGAVLVAGCQRSGTTMLARLISRSDEVADYWTNKDDELDAALILSGTVSYDKPVRHCFQTTYLNECYEEYLRHASFDKLIWVLREPIGVVTSMTKNWGRFAFNELFVSCGVKLASQGEYSRCARFGPWALSSLRRACLSYNAKTSQLFELACALDSQRLAVIDYDDLLEHKETLLPQLYDVLKLPYKAAYAQSIGKGSGRYRLSHGRRRIVERTCRPLYERAYALRTIGPGHASPEICS